MTVMVERRKAPRIQFDKGIDVHILSIDGTWRRPCLLLDVSETGARLKIDGTVENLNLKTEGRESHRKLPFTEACIILQHGRSRSLTWIKLDRDCRFDACQRREGRYWKFVPPPIAPRSTGLGSLIGSPITIGGAVRKLNALGSGDVTLAATSS
jgi:hypothetical protein